MAVQDPLGGARELTPGEVATLDQERSMVAAMVRTSVAMVKNHLDLNGDDADQVFVALVQQMAQVNPVHVAAMHAELLIVAARSSK